MEKTVLLVGVPNCGKSALFCRLTGGHARVGNFAGVTVERREGRLRGGDVRVSDTPGICSLIQTRAEEAVTCDAIRERPALIVRSSTGRRPCVPSASRGNSAGRGSRSSSPSRGQTSTAPAGGRRIPRRSRRRSARRSSPSHRMTAPGSIPCVGRFCRRSGRCRTEKKKSKHATA